MCGTKYTKFTEKYIKQHKHNDANKFSTQLCIKSTHKFNFSNSQILNIEPNYKARLLSRDTEIAT